MGNQIVAPIVKLGRSTAKTTMDVEIDVPIERVWEHFNDVGGL
jgi:hypothetical protein